MPLLHSKAKLQSARNLALARELVTTCEDWTGCTMTLFLSMIMTWGWFQVPTSCLCEIVVQRALPVLVVRQFVWNCARNKLCTWNQLFVAPCPFSTPCVVLALHGIFTWNWLCRMYVQILCSPRNYLFNWSCGSCLLFCLISCVWVVTMAGVHGGVCRGGWQAGIIGLALWKCWSWC